MEINKCMGCMSEFRGYPCPDCGYTPEKQPGQEYVLPLETILAGKYLVGRVLGQGGFGITYIGWDIALERKVAIKEYYPSGQVSRAPGTRTLTWYTGPNAQQARKDGMQMFLKEARKMVKVDSIPSVVRVLDLFQENETAYIVMDFVEGKTLKSILQTSGPMPWGQAKEIFRPVIQAMERVHAAGLVHRDLSPDNLMITPDGKVKILDLGAAKDLNINSGASSMQVAKGGFSPFEQYTQRGGSGPWTDVYAMAATIYYTLTGKVPPVATDRLDEDTLRWNLPNLLALPAPALEALKRAMAVLAKQRTQTMAELETGLFAQAPIPEPKPEPKPEPPKPEPKPECDHTSDVLPPKKMLMVAGLAVLVPWMLILVLAIDVFESATGEEPVYANVIFFLLPFVAAAIPWLITHTSLSQRLKPTKPTRVFLAVILAMDAEHTLSRCILDISSVTSVLFNALFPTPVGIVGITEYFLFLILQVFASILLAMELTGAKKKRTWQLALCLGTLLGCVYGVWSIPAGYFWRDGLIARWQAWRAGMLLVALSAVAASAVRLYQSRKK